jgi:hypothetical protein
MVQNCQQILFMIFDNMEPEQFVMLYESKVVTRCVELSDSKRVVCVAADTTTLPTNPVAAE